ncbi:MAG: hypothetical protein LQ350_008285 [Teloschistes chrysophthalmus]|nr:MAG: hypothetical protein LQ350_008285 [Niorma chrysophthalma]
MDQAAKGAAALNSKDFSTAVTHYTDAISVNSQAVDYYIKRSTAYTRTSPADHTAAFTDAEIALKLASIRGKRELIIQAQLRRAIALFGLEQYENSRACFNWVKEMDKDEKTLQIWEMKIANKLNALSNDDEKAKVTVERLPDVQVPSQKAQSAKPPQDATEPAKHPPENAEKPSKADSVQTPANKIRHEWYQTQDTVVVSLFAKGVPIDKTTIDIQARSLAISFPLATGSKYDFSLDPLYGTIDPTNSSAKFMGTKVDFTLEKTTAGEMWPTLESTVTITDSKDGKSEEAQEVKRAMPANVATRPGPVYPTSSKSGPKNWDKLADELTKKKKEKKNGEEDEDDGMDDFEGGDPVNGFFQQLYSRADPDTRRAMMKSYSESNGTALSTNWSEVGKGKVETQPPDGMEAHRW